MQALAAQALGAHRGARVKATAGALAPELLARERIDALVANVGRVVSGKEDVVRLVVVALLARGHVLIEDVPGVGKTTLAESLARSIGGEFHRIQFTSDLLPADILGVLAFDERSGAFNFRRGPLFANVVLADEINRASPRTQSALLEAMSEGTVSIDDTVHELPSPFLVVATQNPVEHAGTFPLPDSQLDRFLLRTAMGYPSQQAELALLRDSRRPRPRDVEPAVSLADLRQLQQQAAAVGMSDDIASYALAIVRRTREWEAVEVGASPRAALDLAGAARAAALMDGRDHVVPDDVKQLAPAVLAHRLVARGGGTAAASSALAELFRGLIETVPVPT